MSLRELMLQREADDDDDRGEEIQTDRIKSKSIVKSQVKQTKLKTCPVSLV